MGDVVPDWRLYRVEHSVRPLGSDNDPFGLARKFNRFKSEAQARWSRMECIHICAMSLDYRESSSGVFACLTWYITP